MADITLESGWVFASQRFINAALKMAHAFLDVAQRVWSLVRGLFTALAGFIVERVSHSRLQLTMSRVDRDRLFREPIRLHLPDSQRPRRAGRAASISSAWRLAAA